MASVSGAPPVRDVMIFCVPIFWDAELLRTKMLRCSRIRCPRFWDAELGIAGRRPARDMVPAKQKEMPSAHHMTTRTGGGGPRPISPSSTEASGTQTDRQTCRQADRQTGRQRGIHPDRQAYTQTYRQTYRQTDRQTDRQAGRQADRQTNKPPTHSTSHRQLDNIPQKECIKKWSLDD